MAVAPTVILALDSSAGTFTLDITCDPSTATVQITRTANGGSSVRIATGLVPSSNYVTYTDQSVASGVLYSYTVTAVDASGGTASTNDGTVTGS